MRGAECRTPAKFLLRTVILLLLILAVFAGLGVWSGEADAAEKKGTVVIDALNVRTGAGTLNESIGLVYMNDKITILGTAKDYAGTVWYQISYNGGVGFVSSDYVVIDSYNEYVYDPEFELRMDIQGFPESYKPYLRQLHADYPHWVFQAAHTGLEWTAAVDAESKPGVTLVTGTAASSWKSTDPGAYDMETGKYIQYDSGNWVTASRPIIEHYMDPRNFLNAGGIFQFLAHYHDNLTQNAEGLQGVLESTFMAGEFPEDTHATYNQVLMEIGELTGVNPYVLASMILVEQGNSGIGKSISGTMTGYEGYYNHFNVGAYASGGMDAVTRGLWYASQSGTYSRPWDSIYKSIYGGASFYSQNYVQNNKYTLYLKKFNVLNGLDRVGKDQYMTNVQGAESEAAALRKGYLSVMDSSMTFLIPVYYNMPETACLKPVSSANNDNYLKSLSISGSAVYTLTPAFAADQTNYTLKVPAAEKSLNVSAAANSPDATVVGTGQVTLTGQPQSVSVTVTAASGVSRVYNIEVTPVSEDPDGTIAAGVKAASLKASSVLENGTVTISWTVTGQPQIDFYEVFRSTKKTSGFGTKAYYTTADAAAMSFADSGNFEVGNTYYYKVRGVKLIDGVKIYTPWSTKSWRTIKQLPQEEKPQEPETPVTPETPETPDLSGLSSTARGVMATTIYAEASLTEKNTIRVDWKKSPGYKVDYYEVFRSVEGETSFGETAYYKTGSGDKLYYVNTKGLEGGLGYYYKVRGVRMIDGQLIYTCWSNVTAHKVPGDIDDDPDESVQPEAPSQPSEPQVPAAPDNNSLRIGVQSTTIDMSSSLTEKGKIRIDWDKSPGYRVDYYEVFRSTKKSSGYGTKAYYTTSGASKTYYVNTKGLEPGNTYYYKVRGVRLVDGKKIYTKWSNKSWRTIS